MGFFLFSCVFMLVKFLRSPDPRTPWIIGFATGWGALTKATFWVVVPIVLGALLLERNILLSERLKYVHPLRGRLYNRYASFIGFVHYPATGSIRHNWAVAFQNIQPKIEAI